MVALWIILIPLSLISATAGALIALRFQHRTLQEGRQERDAWREAQEGRQRIWEVRQAKRNVEVEKQIFNQVKDLRREWQSWQHEWYEAAEQEQQMIQARVDLEQVLARLPHIEDVELPLNAHTPRQLPDHWQPPTFYRADLRGRDLSHRYIGRADLREAQLMGANLYMTDLTAARLGGANLEGANLAGANLCGADLRGANLRGANLLVADLQNALLHGAILQDVRGLMLPQLHAANYDNTTSIDRAIYTALAPAPDAQSTQPELPRTASEILSEPIENEVTMRMPMLNQSAPRKAAILATRMNSNPETPQTPKSPLTAPGTPEAAQTDTTAAGSPHTRAREQQQEGEGANDGTEENEEESSNKIIHLSPRSTKEVHQVGQQARAAKHMGRTV